MDINEPIIQKEDILSLSDPNFTLENVCIVTGCATGIGRATALVAAANGLRVVGLDVNEAGSLSTIEMAEALGGTMSFVKTDLSVDADIENAVARAADCGQIKYMANIAGIQHIAPIDQFPMEKYDLMQRLMLRAPFYLAQLAIPHIRESAGGTGAIGNMASVHAHICTLNKPVYNIVKFGLRGLTQSIAAEGQGKIRAFSVSTGFVKTPLALTQIPSQAKQRGISEEAVVRDVMMGKSQVKEMMSPVEVGNLFVFGFSRFSNYLDGGDLLFDGGMVGTY